MTCAVIHVKHDRLNLDSFPSSSPQLVTVIIGVPTAVTDVSARTERCVTLSREPASALLDTEAGAVRPSVKWAPMGTDANRNANARMEPPVTM